MYSCEAQLKKLKVDIAQLQNLQNNTKHKIFKLQNLEDNTKHIRFNIHAFIRHKNKNKKHHKDIPYPMQVINKTKKMVNLKLEYICTHTYIEKTINESCESIYRKTWQTTLPHSYKSTKYMNKNPSTLRACLLADFSICHLFH